MAQKYKVLDRPIYGDYGENGAAKMLQPGEVFTPINILPKHLQRMEAAGRIARHFESLGRKAYIVTANKALRPPENK